MQHANNDSAADTTATVQRLNFWESFEHACRYTIRNAFASVCDWAPDTFVLFDPTGAQTHMICMINSDRFLREVIISRI
jgi:hypothetical protein